MFPILNNVLSSGASSLLNIILTAIAAAIFNAISGIYSLFYGLATTRLFRATTIEAISNRIYILVSVVILFAFSVKLIEAIVNPDLLTDAKKGVTGVLKRTIIGLLLLVAVPAIFNFVYYLQAEIIVGGVVEKLMLGYMDSDSSSGIEGAGGTLTSAIITSFIRPVDQNGVPYTESSLCNDDKNCNYADKLADINDGMYEPYLTFLGGEPKYGNLIIIGKEKIWDNGQPIYDISAFALVIVGGFILYQVIILCLDAGLRLVKLGILEVLAPVIIVSYIASGADHLSKWAKMTIQEFTSILIRIAGLCFMVMGFQLMNEPDSIFNNDSVSIWFKIFLIIGLLRLVKELPDLLGKLFGANIKMGSIKDKLGEMAGVGKMAQNAWGAMGGLAKAGAGAIGSGVGKFVKKGSEGLATDLRKASDKRVAKWNSKHPDKDYYTDTRRGRFAQKAGAVGRALPGAIAGGARVAGAIYKDGGKDTKKAIDTAVKENFGREVKEHEQRKQDVKDAKMAVKINAATQGALQFKKDKDGNFVKDGSEGIDYKASAKGKDFAAAAKTNSDIIKNMGNNLSKMQMDNLEKLNEKKQTYNESQRKMDLYNDLEKQLTEMKGNTKNQEQIGMIKNALNDLSAGKLDMDSLNNTLKDVGKISGVEFDEKGNPVFNGKGASNALSDKSFTQLASTVLAAANNAESSVLGTSHNTLETENTEAKEKLDKQTKVVEEEKKTIKEGTDMYEAFDAIVSSMDKLYNAVNVENRTTDAGVINEAIGASNKAIANAVAAAKENPNVNYNEAPEPAPQAAPQPAPQAASNSNNSGGTSGGTVKADIDTSGLEAKLDEINTSIKTGSEKVASQVRLSGEELKSGMKLNSEALGNLKNSVDETNDSLSDVEKAARNTNDKLDENNNQ
ncbi:MAG: hypothetical protein IKP98_00075 [Bacilli bacterium]|nr:hypothetical protein [Bacilli bacterium]